ncbi:hypothetical protein BZL30_3664 [Mycobacterium kansasii]|uniref:Uncharacterized protein n=1 Tax=Mycobacterium kansasii TaxID=1768 RepID=A0A1V3X217_MYCKA|nr:hypothetical protein BZL29_5266 [Mycobacterium kansasii]OOK76061.1 hypothetical protein BZL30_3664 [Mycobacterium kansasii]
MPSGRACSDENRASGRPVAGPPAVQPKNQFDVRETYDTVAYFNS